MTLHKRLKLTFLLVSLRGGGTERVVTKLANRLQSKHEVSIVTLVESPSFYFVEKGITLLQPSSSQPRKGITRRLCQISHVRHALLKLRPDACYIFGEDIAGVFCPVVKLAGVKMVFAFLRGSPDRSLSGLTGVFNPIALCLADRVVVQTEHAANQLKRRYGLCNLCVLPNPIEAQEALPVYASRGKQVIYVASMGRNKNHKQLIEAFATCPNWRDWQLVLVGEGPNRCDLERLAIKLGIASNTKFLGQRSDVKELLRDSQIFAFPSLSEGFPNALGEALANGCACISIDCPCGPSELICDGYNGFLVPPNSNNEFREKLAILMSDSHVRREFSENALTEIRRFSDEIIFQKFEELIYAH